MSSILYKVSQLPRGAAVAIYGSGEAGRFFLDYLRWRRRDISMRFFIDSFRSGSCDGLEVVPLERALPRLQPGDRIVVCSQYAAEIAARLEQAGVCDFLVADEKLHNPWRLDAPLLPPHLPFDLRLNHYRCNYSARRGLARSLGRPMLLTIEPTNCCNLGCPICETGAGVLERPKGMLSFERFRLLLDQFDTHLRRLFFYFMGEPMLNPDSYRMIRYAADRGIAVSTCLNGSLVDPARLVESGVAEVNFQIAGMTQEVHAVYRVGSDLGEVLVNLEKTLELRRAHPHAGRSMRVLAGFILMKHNQHEVDDFVAYCRKLDLDGFNIIGTTARTVEQAERYLPDDPRHRRFDEAALRAGELRSKKYPLDHCGWLYGTVTVMVDGSVVPCCYDPQGRHVLGNVFTTPIGRIWNNAAYRAVRRRVAALKAADPMCRLCMGEVLPPLPEVSG